MEEIETLSHHSMINLSQKIPESKLHKCWELLLSFNYGNLISVINIILSISSVAIYIYTNYLPNVVLIHSTTFFAINFACRIFFAIVFIFDIISLIYVIIKFAIKSICSFPLFPKIH